MTNDKLDGHKILVVDDRLDNLHLISGYLEEAGAEIMVAHNGKDGLAKARLGRPELILLDVMMPDMDGFEVCRQLKQSPELVEMPVIFLSALGEIENKIHGFEAGGVDYLEKPFQKAELLARVRTHLALCIAHRELAGKNVELTKKNADLQAEIIRRKQAEQSLTQAKKAAEAANRAKSAFLANMSHELRTPLNAIQGFAQIMEMDNTLADEHRHSIQGIRHGGDYLLTLINDILDLAKIEAGRFELFPVAWNTESFFRELNEMFRLQAAQKNISFCYNSLNPLPRVLYCDDKRLRQIAMNLLSNAVKFTDQGKVTLCTDVAENRLILEVTDTGTGISPEMLNTIFESFQQGGNSLQKIQGTGLGLSITRKLVETMGGEISVQSTPGAGSTFRAVIPAETISTLVEARGQQEENMPTVTGYRRTRGEDALLQVLIVDDVEDNREVLRLLLEPLGFVTLQAENGRQCLEIARSRRPDVILLDLRMPEMSGRETACYLCKISQLRGTPIIAVTASAFAEAHEAALAAGCDACLTKPIRFTELLDALSKLLPLEWTYAEPPAGADPQIGKKKDGNLSAEQITQLTELIEIGSIYEIQELAKNIKDSGCCPGFAYKLKISADEFNMHAIRQLLKTQQTINEK
ncbi:MAG: response regulator [Gammaproteobacteria bacterium]|nr:response regulator [Gammaproteobacteria bacterium]